MKPLTAHFDVILTCTRPIKPAATNEIEPFSSCFFGGNPSTCDHTTARVGLSGFLLTQETLQETAG